MLWYPRYRPEILGTFFPMLADLMIEKMLSEDSDDEDESDDKEAKEVDDADDNGSDEDSDEASTLRTTTRIWKKRLKNWRR